ncbi:hypothetical protein ACQ4PT_056008 [Festuca glaucescens]
MDPFSPATPPATKQDQPSSTQLAEDEVVASLLLLKEAAGPKGETALQEDKENYRLVPDESTVEVNMDVEKEALDKTLAVTSSLAEEFSGDESLDEEEENDALEPEGHDKEEEDNDASEEEEVEEYDCQAPVNMEEVRRCNRNNGCGWICSELAEPGSTMCLRHIIARREAYQRFQSKKLQGSTSGSEATVEPKIEDAVLSAIGDQEEAASPSSPGTLASAKRRKASDPTLPDDEAA